MRPLRVALRARLTASQEQQTGEACRGGVPLNRYVIFFSIALVGCLADLWTKHWVFRWLGMPRLGQPPWWVWRNVVGLQTSLNDGALFGLGQGWVAVFALLSILAAVGILCWLFLAAKARDLLLTIALGAVTAGILGNLYDRLGLPGLRGFNGQPIYAVRDWIAVMIYHWQWPNFNLADSLLVSGACLLIWYTIRSDGKAAENR